VSERAFGQPVNTVNGLDRKRKKREGGKLVKAKKVLKRLYLGVMIAAVSNLPLLVYGMFNGSGTACCGRNGGHLLKHLLVIL